MRRVSANKNVLSSHLNSVRQMSCCRSSTGRLFHSRGTATPKLLSPSLDCVRGTVCSHKHHWCAFRFSVEGWLVGCTFADRVLCQDAKGTLFIWTFYSWNKVHHHHLFSLLQYCIKHKTWNRVNMNELNWRNWHIKPQCDTTSNSAKKKKN